MSKQHEFQHLARAYLEAASRLQEQRREGVAITHPERLLPIPTAHLICHGIELALKSNLLFAGVDGTRRLAGPEFGHDLLRLWKHPENASLQREILARAHECWIEAKESGRWPQQQNWDEDPRSLLERTLEELNDLHTRANDYALRYGSANGQMILPKTYLVRDVFARQLLEKWPVIS